MASDSIIGAVGNNLSNESKSLLTEVIAQIKGTAAYVSVGESTAVFGPGDAGAIVGSLPASKAAIAGELKDTNFVANVELPANTGVNFQGPSTNVTTEAAADYFNALIDAALPKGNESPAVQEKAQSLKTAVDVVKSIGPAADATVRYVEVVSTAQAGASGSVKIVGSGSSAKEIVAINTAQLGTNQQLILQDLEKVVLVNKADVVVTGTKAALVVGDNADQKITGGQGADTLVGGGGNDTLVGGAGSDTFGFVSGGRFVLGDFNPTNDKLTFEIPGISNFNQLASLVTRVENTASGVVYTFGNAGSITLVGISSAEVTADLISFTLA